MYYSFKRPNVQVLRMIPYWLSVGDNVSSSILMQGVLGEAYISSRTQQQSSLKIIGFDKEGFLTNVYGLHLPSEKIHFLENLEDLNTIIQDIFCILGSDFNIILSLEENQGGIRQMEGDNEGFKILIDNLQLVNLENINGDFT
jgi:hypothetical protein